MANRYPYAPPPTRPGIEPQNVPGFSNLNMWPQQTPPNAVVYQQQLQLAEKQRQKEYLKQQQKLRLMAGTTNKQPVSADKLIENLLDTKDTFRLKVNAQRTSAPVISNLKTPVGSHLPQQSSMTHGTRHVHYPQAYHTLPALQTNAPVTGSDDVAGNFSARTVQESCSSSSSGMNFQLPSWLMPHSPALPALYNHVWSIVGIDNGLVDTNKIFPLLLTSGLPTDVLGYIWSIANKKIAGQLTEVELYVVLALVGLAQNGCTFNNISVLNLIPQAPIPNLNLSAFEVTTLGVEPSTCSVSTTQPVQLLQSVKSTSIVSSGATHELEGSEEESFQAFNEKSDSSPSISSNQVPEEEIDDFSDFQSAVVSEEQKSSIHVKNDSSSPPTVAFQGVSSTDGMKSFTSLFSLSSSNRGIGSRLANHSLGAPKQVKSRHHKHHNHHHHHHHHHRNSQPAAHQSAHVDVQPPLPLRDEPMIPVGEEDEFSDFQQAKEESLSRVNSSELFQKCSTSSPYLLKESAIRSEKQNTVLFDSPVHVKLKSDVERKEISTSTDCSLVVNTEICEVNPNAQNTASVAPGPELLTVEDDKYSALRALSAADQTFEETKEPTDDFGDFLSAEPVSTDDSFVALAVRDVNLRPGEMPVENSPFWPLCPEGNSQNVEFQVDDWGAFETAADANTLHETNTFASTNFKTDLSESGILSISSDLDGLDLKSSKVDFKQETNSNKGLQEFLDKSLSGMHNVVDLSAGNSSTSDFNVESGEELSHSQSNFKEINPLQSESGSFVMNSTDDDEFGEFIGPEAWSENGKFAAKESNFEDPSMLRIKDTMCDNQSVSSLELPVLSRHGSLPSLDLKIFPSTADKTGVHHSWESSPQIDSSLHGTVAHRSKNQEGIDLQIKEWCRCLQSCLQLLQAALATFTNILNDNVLEEVVKSHDGKEYLLNLLEVYGICKRVKQSSNGVCSDSKLDSVLAEVDMIWCSMEQYFCKADIKVNEMDFGCSAADVNQEHTPCGICLTSVGSDIVEENPNNIYPLEYSGQVYHAACANLWVNCVDCRLPALATTGSLL